MPISNAGDLRDRIRIERFTAGAWVLVAVLWANVVPGPPPRPELAHDAQSAASEAAERFDIVTRYRTDLGDDSKALRVRRGADTLIVLQAVRDVDGTRRWSKLVAERFVSYVTRHDAMLARVALQGAAITFSKPTTSSNNAATYESGSDTAATPPATTVVSGRAMAASDSRSYEANSNVQQAVLELLFVPDIYGTLPAPGATATWNGVDIVIATVGAIAYDGVAIGARIAMER